MSEERKRIHAEELGLKTDEEALNFVKKLRSAGTTIYFLTDGDKDRWIVGKFDDTVPLLPLALKEKIESLEKEVESIKSSIQELKVAKAVEPSPQAQQKIQLPELPTTFPEAPKPLTENPPTPTVIETPQLGFKSRQEIGQVPIVPTQEIPMRELTFNCPSCKNVFSEKVPVGKKVVEVKCPKCGMTIYKKSWWTRRKKITVVGLVCLALFFIWLFI